MPALFRYHKLLNEDQVIFKCPHCPQFVSSDTFESHCTSEHQLNSNLNCVWCFGHEHFKNKSKHVSHLISCYEIFINPIKKFTKFEGTQPNNPMLLDLPPIFLSIDFSDKWMIDLTLTGLTFQSDFLNLATSCLQLYLETQTKYNWFYIKIPNFSSLQKALDEDEGKTRILPFTCDCKNHFIIATTHKGCFVKKFWKKMTVRNTLKTPIKSPMEFIDALSFNCDVSLPLSYKMMLALQWEGGLMELVKKEYALIEPQLLAPFATSFNGLWGVRIIDLPGIPFNRVLPVSEHFQPTLNPTDYFIYLTHGRKMYFEHSKEKMKDWVNEQAEKGNLFLQAIGDEIYYPTPYQQKCISFMKPVLTQIIDLQYNLKEKSECLTKLNESLNNLKKSNVALKRKFNVSEKSLKSLQIRHIEYLERENNLLRNENIKIKRRRFM